MHSALGFHEGAGIAIEVQPLYNYLILNIFITVLCKKCENAIRSAGLAVCEILTKLTIKHYDNPDHFCCLFKLIKPPFSVRRHSWTFN